MPQIETCINTLKAPADQLLKEGVDPLFIMAALAEIIVDVAETDRNVRRRRRDASRSVAAPS